MNFFKKLFCSALSLRELLLLICTLPYLMYGLDAVYRILIPRPIYPYEYSYYSIIVRLVLYLSFLIFVAALIFGVWLLVKKSEEARLLKWIAYLVLSIDLLVILTGFVFGAVELVGIDPKYFPYELKQSN